jgi:hypothetical protein
MKMDGSLLNSSEGRLSGNLIHYVVPEIRDEFNLL